MCKSENQDHYEIFIILHIGDLVKEKIRIKSAWHTLQKVFYNLNSQPLTSCEYNSEQIESLIGFQRNSKNLANDMILNWKRLKDQALILIENIELY
ncbi:hypothetical protein AWQ22_08715 [Picosynechococcus sp. PCC 7117]|nr:hypothetical protein AWQ22_08715 [Picosynechococcus sp. PCC 7117]